MTSPGEQDIPEPDPIDEEAAEIDARSPDAPEQIEELKQDAERLGRDVEEDTMVDVFTVLRSDHRHVEELLSRLEHGAYFEEQRLYRMLAARR